jgi:hypothetical protein
MRGKYACFRAKIVEISDHLLVVKERFIVMEEKMTKQPAQNQRRGMLRKAFLAVAGLVGAGSLLAAKAAPAHANGSEGPTTFTATGGATAVSAQSDTGVGLIGFSDSGAGVEANSHTGYGLSATSGTGVSVEAYSTSVVAVDARSNTGTGLHAVSNSGIGAILESTSGVAVQVKGRIQVQGDCIGQAFMRSGTSSLVVNAHGVTPNSLILLTPLSYWEGGVLSVFGRKNGSFTINSTMTLIADATIGYLIVN